MKISIDTIISQAYLTPYIKITYDKWLNGYYEISLGWLHKQLTISWNY